MKHFFKSILYSVIVAGWVACGSGEEPVPNPKPVPGDMESLLELTAVDELNQSVEVLNSHADVTSRSSLKMNYRTYRELDKRSLGVDKPHYPRVKRLANGEYLMFYHNNQIGAACYYARSKDAKVWSARGRIFDSKTIVDSKGKTNKRCFSNCDAVVLANGDVLAVASFRAEQGYRELPKDAGVMMRRSTNNGTSWGEEQIIYQGVTWEPYIIELPSGKIQCYFTDSNRTGIEGTDTGTAMVESVDGGKTWTPEVGQEPYYVIRTEHMVNGRKCFNNQMPSVIQLNGSDELAAAVEAHIGDYNISFAYSGEDGEWDKLTVTEEGPADRHDLAFKGCAPYIGQFRSGETVLSYNQSSTYFVKMGDARARNFTKESYAPFPGKGFWGNLLVIDTHRMIGAMPNTGKNTVMLAQFILNHRVTATRRTVVVDGDNAEWEKTDQALFVGEKSQAQATLRCSADAENIYFLVEALDNMVTKSDCATIYISPVTKDDVLADGALRIQVGAEGLKSLDEYSNGSWVSAAGSVTAVGACDGVLGDANEDYGYLVEVAVPRSMLRIRSGEVLLNFAQFDGRSSEEDAIVDEASATTAQWIPLNGL